MANTSTLVVSIGIVGALVGLLPLPMTGFAYGVLLVIGGIVLRSLGH